MTILFVVLLTVVALTVAIKRGPATALNWVFIPVFLLTPLDLWIHIPALPDLNARRAVIICIFVVLLARPSRDTAPLAKSKVDTLMLLAIVAWSWSYGVHTDLMGFVHSMAALSVDLWLPYVLARRLWRNWNDLAEALLPLGFCALALAGLAVYEARMINRGYARIWDSLFDTGVLPYFEMWRWGFLRAGVLFNHPITLGVSFAMLAPLMLLWGKLVPRWDRWSRVAAVGCVLGAIATISRGPIIAAFLGVIVAVFMRKERRYVYALLGLAVVVSVPYLYNLLQDSMAYVQASLAERGNVESGYYRIALFMIYFEEIRAGGWFGNPQAVGQRYELAWSIDNSYIYMFLTYGWLGGFIFLLLGFSMIVIAMRATARSDGEGRVRMACIAGAAAATAFAILNVWFSGDYSPLFFVLLAVVVNMAGRASEATSPAGIAGGAPFLKGSRKPRHPRQVPAVKYPRAINRQQTSGPPR